MIVKNEFVADIKRLIARETLVSEVEDESALLAKLQGILAEDSQQRQEDVSAIRAFLEGSEIQKRKLLVFCADFVDTTVKPATRMQNGEEIQLNALLQQDEITKLAQFVKAHATDKTFNQTVYNVMARHNLSAPQVYGAVYMPRQDFFRAVDDNAPKVSRRLVWRIILGLHCNIDEADEVLYSAGYIRRASNLDLTFEYFIKHNNYDIRPINDVLHELGVKVYTLHTNVKDRDVKS